MKLLVCDVEGTIFKAKYRIEGTEYASTMWQPLAQRLGVAAIAAELYTHRKWENSGYGNYIEWVEDTVEIHKFHKLHKDTFNSLIAEAEYIDGVVEFFNKLDRSKYVPVLVSGGFQELVRRAQKELNIKYGYGACEYEFDPDTGYLLSHTMTPCDFEGKYQYVNALFSIYNLNPNKDWVFIGDGKNDVHIAGKAPLAYGINPHADLEKVVCRNFTSFSQIYSQMIDDENICIMDEEDLVHDHVNSVSTTKDEIWAAHLANLEDTQNKLKNKEFELQLTKSEIEELKTLFAISSSENKEMKQDKDSLTDKYSKLEKEILELKKNEERAKKLAEKENISRLKIIKDIWVVLFRRFSFTDSFLYEAAKLLHADLMKLQDKLLQLHEEPDPRDLARCRLENSNYHLRFYLSGGVRARLDYRVMIGQQYKVEIVEFYKRKDYDRVMKHSD